MQSREYKIQWIDRLINSKGVLLWMVPSSPWDPLLRNEFSLVSTIQPWNLPCLNNFIFLRQDLTTHAALAGQELAV